MMTSKQPIDDHAFVWIWLPGEIKPVVAGKLTQQGEKLLFNYGQSYLKSDKAISIFDKELPLKPGLLPLPTGLNMPSCIRDAAPDAWGRRVIINKQLGLKKVDKHFDLLDELTFLLQSGSDRIGALDFQRSATIYEPRSLVNVELAELMASADRVEQGFPLSLELDQALYHGSSIGGARPKALVDAAGRKYVAKFSSSSDLFNVVKAEFVAMRLAKLAGLNVAEVSIVKSSHKDVLLIERFDRVQAGSDWQRRSMLSALTLLGLDEMMARYASYEDLTHIIRHRFTAPVVTLKELFGRIVFNILSGNTDDHARNHAAFWNGISLELTPAYDICPQGRSGYEATQAMLISGDDRASQLSTCIHAASLFFLTESEAIELIVSQLTIICKQWRNVCDAAELNDIDREFLWGRQFLNPYAFYNLSTEAKFLETIADNLRVH
jgi:serine/threonine-protein kinase HipA